MVRLLLATMRQFAVPCRPFQSHNGAIATSQRQAKAKGKPSFNPTMVRLLLLQGSMSPSRAKWFQSHNGAIATADGQTAIGKLPSFNPTMVRLLHSVIYWEWWRMRVSIPQWCDCYLSSAASVRLLSSVSIPQWCDCYQATRRGRRAGWRFQSHNGAIATQPSSVLALLNFLFQSHNGAIATAT